MTALIAALLIYSAIPHGPNTGTYAVTTDGPYIVRMDTRTGTMERCTLVGSVVTCEPATVAAK